MSKTGNNNNAKQVPSILLCYGVHKFVFMCTFSFLPNNDLPEGALLI